MIALLKERLVQVKAMEAFYKQELKKTMTKSAYRKKFGDDQDEEFERAMQSLIDKEKSVERDRYGSDPQNWRAADQRNILPFMKDQRN